MGAGVCAESVLQEVKCTLKARWRCVCFGGGAVRRGRGETGSKQIEKAQEERRVKVVTSLHLREYLRLRVKTNVTQI